jgi:four helix bundle protein
MNSEILKTRSKKLAIDTILFTRKLPKSPEAKIIVNQIIRSSTSTAANYRAVLRARSDAEFFSKLTIVVEEADETLFWYEVIEETGLNNSETLNILKKEATELLYIFSASRKSIKNTIDNRKSKNH